MNDVRHLLARNMKRCREILGITQEKLAGRVGCSTTFIANIEIGKRFPSAGSFDKIAAALEVHPSELFRGEATSFLCFGSSKDIRRAFEEEMTVALDKVEERLEKEASTD
ncbi:MAG: helix-turn-helix transcriptional regulator [Spirochaetota bacterium]